MPTPAHTKFVISGTLPGGEVWATSFSVLNAPTVQGDLDSATQDVATALSSSDAGISAIRGCLSSQDVITAVRGYAYAAGATSASLQSEVVTNITGGGGTPVLNQAAIVASLRTGAPGRRKRGRMYLPANGISYSGDTAQLAQVTCDNIALGVSELIKVPVAIGPPIVVSRVGAMATEITQVRVDSRLDVVRARANKQTALHVGVHAV